MNVIRIRYCKSKLGEIIVGVFKDQLCLLDFRYRKMRNAVDNRLKRCLRADYVERDHPLMDEILTQLDGYLAGIRTEFDVPILMAGTDFQKEVWSALLEVGFGQTSTYQIQSNRIGKPDAVRAVASANGANAMSIIIPCHRIIGSDGSLVGYGGGLPLKKRLLHLEQGHSFDCGDSNGLRNDSSQSAQECFKF